jgi:hypothetical protein
MPRFDFVFLRPVVHRLYLFGFEADDGAINTLHANISLAVSVLLNFILQKYQGNQNSPFEANPIMVYLGVASLLLYGLSYFCLQRISQHHRAMRSFAHIVYRCMLFFGYLSVSALASLLDSGLAAIVLFPVSIMLSVGDLLYSIYRRMRAELRETYFQEENVQHFFNRLMGRRFVNHRQILPV